MNQSNEQRNLDLTWAMWVKSMSTLRRALDGVYLVGAYLSGLLLILLCGLVIWSILARLLGVFAGGASDVAGYVMATSTFMALAYTFRSQGHIRVALLIQNVMGAKRRALEFLCLGVMPAVSIYLAYYMITLAEESYEWEERSEGADAILLWIPQTPVALGSALFALAVVHTFLEAVFDYDSVDPNRKSGEGPNEI